MVRYRMFPFKDLKYFFSGAAFLGGSSVYALVVPVIVIPHLIEVVGLGNYGVSVIAFSITFFLSLVIDFGYTISGVNSLSKSNTDYQKNSIIIKAIYTKVVLFLGTTILLLLLIIFIPFLRVHVTLFLWSLLIPFSSVFNLNWALQGLQMIKWLSILSIINKSIYLIGVLFVVRAPSDYIYINFIFGLGVLITGLASLFKIKQQIGFKCIGFTYKELVTEIKESAHYFVSNISIYMASNLYPVILGFFTSSEIVGVFAAIEKVYNVMRAPFSIYINLMLPKVSEVIEQSKKQAVQLIKETYFFVVLFMLLVIYLVWNFQEPIIKYFVKGYIELPTDLLYLALTGLVIVIFNCPQYVLLLAMDVKKAIMKTFIIIPLIGIIVCLFLARLFEAKGVFYTIIIVELLYVVSLNRLLYAQKIISRKRT